MRTTIYLVRHSQIYNPKKVFYGRLPYFDLSKKGKENAKKVGEHFKNIEIDEIYASPMLRTRKTAKAIAKRHKGLKVHVSKALYEWNIPTWNGKKATEIKDFEKQWSNTDNIKFKDSETAGDVKKRMVNKIQLFVRNHPGKTAVMVSHGGPIKLARLSLENNPTKDLHDIKCAYSSITKLVLNSGKLVELEYKEVVKPLKETI